MGRRSTCLTIVALGSVLAACAESPKSTMPTEPLNVALAKPVACNFNAIQSAVNDEFPSKTVSATNTSVSTLVKSMKSFYGAGDASSATAIGYQVMDTIATVGRAVGTPAAGSNLTYQLLLCMTVGTNTATATTFVTALSPGGAYGVRGRTATDAADVISDDNAWVLQTPINPATSQPYPWTAITTLAVTGLADSVKEFLVYGFPTSPTGFTNDQLISANVFDWNTTPIATFNPRVIIGECKSPSNFMQHFGASSSNVEILGYVTPRCPVAALQVGARKAARSLFARVADFFAPPALYAASLGSIGSAGTKGSLSPFGVVYPGVVNLTNLTVPSKSGNTVGLPITPTPLVQAKSAAGTPFKQNIVFVYLTVIGNNGIAADVCNNWAYTNDNGIAQFPTAVVNKAGGYTLISQSTGTQAPPQYGDPNTPFVPPGNQPTSPLFNVKNGTELTTCNVYRAGDPLPPPPGPNGYAPVN